MWYVIRLFAAFLIVFWIGYRVGRSAARRNP